MASSRDDFSTRVKNILARRVGVKCSNPICRCSTSGPAEETSKSVNIGVAAHITAAANGGPRYELSLTNSLRRSTDNGIWLCQNCAKLIDNDVSTFTVELLQEWKALSESKARDKLLGLTLDVEDTPCLIHTPRLGWMAGMGYNACFQAATDGNIDSDNLRGLIYQTQPLLQRLGVAISLNQEMSKPKFLQDHALPLEFRIQGELVAIHGRLVAAAFALGKNIGPTTGLIMRYIQNDEVRRKIQKQQIQPKGLTAAVDSPLKTLRAVVGQNLLEEWYSFRDQIADGSANGATALAMNRWRHRIKEIMTE